MIGIIILVYGIVSFMVAVELYIGYRFDRDFNGCIFVGRRGFPWMGLISPLIYGLIGLSLIKNSKQLLIFTILFSFIFSVSTILFNVIKFLWCNFSLTEYGASCVIKFPILELGGILFFVIILSEYRKHNWKKEIIKFGLKKYLIGFILMSILMLLLYKI